MTLQSFELQSIVTADGEEFDLFNGYDKWTLAIPDNLGISDVSPVVYENISQIPEEYDSFQLEARAITVQLRVQGCSREEYWAKRTELINFMRPNRGGELTFLMMLPNQGSPQTYALDAIVTAMPLAPADEWDMHGFTESISLMCHNPTIYVYETSTASVVEQDLQELIFPIIFGDVFSNALYQDGDAPNEITQIVGIDPSLDLTQVNYDTTGISISALGELETDYGLYFFSAIIAATDNTGYLTVFDTFQIPAQNDITFRFYIWVFPTSEWTSGIQARFAGNNSGFYLPADQQAAVENTYQKFTQQITVNGDAGLEIRVGKIFSTSQHTMRVFGLMVMSDEIQLSRDNSLHDYMQYAINSTVTSNTGGPDYLGDEYYNVVTGTSAFDGIGLLSDSSGTTNEHDFPVITGEQYEFVVYVKANGSWTGGDEVYIRLADQDGTTLFQTAFTDVSGSVGTWVKLDATYTVGSGVTHIKFEVRKNNIAFARDFDVSGFCILDPTKDLTVAGGFNDGVPLIREQGIYFENTSKFGSFNETYTGTWEARPVITITGPAVNPRITHEQKNIFIQMNYSISAGEIVTIDLENDTITNDDGDDLVFYITEGSNTEDFTISPAPTVASGINTITIEASGTDANTDSSITYNRREIGI